MRFMLYNIRYGTGSGWRFHLPFPFSGYLRPTERNLARIARFMQSLEPDIIGLVEVDNGTFRSGKRNQAEVIAEEMGYTHVYQSKYGEEHFSQNLPLMKKQGNALITNQSIVAQDFHYFQNGIKRLVIELEFDDFVVFLVHLSLKYRHRQYQLRDLYEMFSSTPKPTIVAGDFNAFWGDKELDLFLAATGLRNANTSGAPTYPSRTPSRQLDFILHTSDIEITGFQIPRVRFSDHRPVVCDFTVTTRA